MSDLSNDENGERHLTRYLVEKSLVERSRQSQVKKALDDVHQEPSSRSKGESGDKTGPCKAINTIPAHKRSGLGSQI